MLVGLNGAIDEPTSRFGAWLAGCGCCFRALVALHLAEIGIDHLLAV
jgi:hypothetical protein